MGDISEVFRNLLHETLANEIIAKYEKGGKYFQILQEATNHTTLSLSACGSPM